VWSVAGQDTRYGAMHMLRILRVFRIIWILKHFKFMNFRTLLAPGGPAGVFTGMPHGAHRGSYAQQLA